MRVRDMIEELIQIEKDYGNLHLNRFDTPVGIRIYDDHIVITGGEINE